MGKYKKRKTRPILERIMEKVVKDPISGCWNYTGTLINGYGSINTGKFGPRIFLHREMYKIYKGNIPKGMLVCHKCDNPKCCNPDHLFMGTHKDNMQDMWKKGRKIIPHGEQAYYHKFTTKQIDNIRKDKRPYSVITKEYNITKSHVSYIKNFKTRING